MWKETKWIHYFGHQSCENRFPPHIHSNPLDLKWCLCVFWSIWKPSECKMKQNLYFKQECTILGYGSCENHFPPKAFILIPHTNNGVWKCFGAFWKPSECKIKQNLCFGAECTISGYRSCEYYFPPNASILIHRTNKCICECFGSFGNL
jgi:hypothetical protein